MREAERRIDCLIVGGGPAGLTAALYLARFGRRFLLIDAGQSRASSIPTSHNFPPFPEGVSGPDLLARQREHLRRYGAVIGLGTVSRIATLNGEFIADIADAQPSQVSARRVLLATGARDVEPEFPGLDNAVRKGFVRYCPICDGYEAKGRRIGVLAHGRRGLGEAVFIARTYAHDVTLLACAPLDLTPDDRKRIAERAIEVVDQPIQNLGLEQGRLVAVRTATGEHRFDAIYSALGLERRAKLGIDLGAAHDEAGALIVDEHSRTSVPGLYAAGGVVRGLDQVVVAMGQAAIAATAIHNRCELPTEDEG